MATLAPAPKATHSIASFYREDESGMQTESEADFSDSEDESPAPATKPSVPSFYRKDESGLETESEAEFSDSDSDGDSDEGDEYTTEGAYLSQHAYTYIEVEEASGIERATRAMEIEEAWSESEATFTDGEEGESIDESYVDDSFVEEE